MPLFHNFHVDPVFRNKSRQWPSTRGMEVALSECPETAIPRSGKGATGYGAPRCDVWATPNLSGGDGTSPAFQILPLSGSVVLESGSTGGRILLSFRSILLRRLCLTCRPLCTNYRIAQFLLLSSHPIPGRRRISNDPCLEEPYMVRPSSRKLACPGGRSGPPTNQPL